MCDKKIASYSLLTRKNLYQKNVCQLRPHKLEVDTYCDLWRKTFYMSIDTLQIEMTCITRQLKFYKLQLNYPKNITHNSRRISYEHLHTLV